MSTDFKFKQKNDNVNKVTKKAHVWKCFSAQITKTTFKILFLEDLAS